MRRSYAIIGVVLAAAVVIVLAPMASPDPDGLERVAADAGFASAAAEPGFGVLPDYSVPFLGDGAFSLIVAGLFGVALIFAATWLMGRVLARRAGAGD